MTTHTQQEVTTMNELTDERLAELRRIAETPQSLGAWKASDGVDWNYRVVAGYECLADTGDAGITDHIAAFDPPTVLALVAELTEARKWLRGGIEARRSIKTERDELQHRLDAVEARHTPVTVRYGDAPDELACRACGTHYEYPVAWPCPTVKAAKGEQR